MHVQAFIPLAGLLGCHSLPGLDGCRSPLPVKVPALTVVRRARLCIVPPTSACDRRTLRCPLAYNCLTLETSHPSPVVTSQPISVLN